MAAVSSSDERRYFFPMPEAYEHFERQIEERSYNVLPLENMKIGFSEETWALFENAVAHAPNNTPKNHSIYQIILELPRFFSLETQEELKQHATSIFSLFKAVQERARDENGILLLKDLELTNRASINEVCNALPPHLECLPFKEIDVYGRARKACLQVPVKHLDRDRSITFNFYYRKDQFIKLDTSLSEKTEICSMSLCKFITALAFLSLTIVPAMNYLTEKFSKGSS